MQLPSLARRQSLPSPLRSPPSAHAHDERLDPAHANLRFGGGASVPQHRRTRPPYRHATDAKMQGDKHGASTSLSRSARLPSKRGSCIHINTNAEQTSPLLAACTALGILEAVPDAGSPLSLLLSQRRSSSSTVVFRGLWALGFTTQGSNCARRGPSESRQIGGAAGDAAHHFRDRLLRSPCWSPSAPRTRSLAILPVPVHPQQEIHARWCVITCPRFATSTLRPPTVTPIHWNALLPVQPFLASPSSSEDNLRRAARLPPFARAGRHAREAVGGRPTPRSPVAFFVPRNESKAVTPEAVGDYMMCGVPRPLWMFLPHANVLLTPPPTS
ncbi:hypothetical protein B0H13DRAFT_2391177 [Mycena leptocephala]|nr:hypothetical protein B0H13DRAFT_2391177 [Mycena leptocephala]